jgi:UDP-2,3-diacylglucosamine hydrolase
MNDPTRLPGRGGAVFVADAHLNRPDLHTEAFVALLGQAAREGTRLYLLGDIFDLWFGAPRFTFAFQRPVIDALRRLRDDEGLEASYVEGNRDFFLREPYEGVLFESVSEGILRLGLSGRSVSMAHGDGVVGEDLWYRIWKALSKNRLSFSLFRALPPAAALPLAERIERGLKETNHRFRGRFPEGDCLRFAGGEFRRGAGGVVLGHFHAEYLHADGEGRFLAVLPCWKEGHRHFYLSPDGRFGFRTFTPGEPLVP